MNEVVHWDSRIEKEPGKDMEILPLESSVYPLLYLSLTNNIFLFCFSQNNYTQFKILPMMGATLYLVFKNLFINTETTFSRVNQWWEIIGDILIPQNQAWLVDTVPSRFTNSRNFGTPDRNCPVSDPGFRHRCEINFGSISSYKTKVETTSLFAAVE